MNIPFRDLFDKLRASFPLPSRGTATPESKPSVLVKPESEKLAKTVRPNAVQTVTPETTMTDSAPAAGPRMVSLGRTGSTQSRDLPPAVALALEPRVERVLSVALSDVVAEMPEGYLKPTASFDTDRRVLLKAVEVEKGMASGRPAMPVSALYQQMPEIFMHVVPATDDAIVALPFDKVLDELSQLALRQDQMSEEVVPQFETPFLRVTMEETEKFGVPMAPVQLAEMPPVRLEPATAHSIAAAEPEPILREKLSAPIAKISANAAPPPSEILAAAVPDARPVVAFNPPLSTEAPARTAAHNLEQIGTGEPAFPRVPASSGPPVPPAASAPPPVRIPFDLPPPAANVSFTPRQSAPPPRVQNLDRTSAAAVKTEPQPRQPMVTLPLRSILKTLPPMQLGGDPAAVPTETKISFPFSLIAPQLPTGKVVIAPKDFHAAMPSEHRDLFLPAAIDAPVPISLADVLGHLPADALRMRGDQETHTPDEVFETPFSKKAEEDARRFAEEKAAKARQERVTIPAAVDPLAAEQPFVEQEDIRFVSIPGLEIESPAPNADGYPEKAPEFDAREAVSQASALSGVAACGVTFADGLSIASNIPAELRMDGLSAVAPTLLQKLEKHMLQTQLGPLTCLTVHGEKSPVTFFAAGSVCLTAVHRSGELGAETRRALGSITQQLSHTYAQPETTHVDH